MVKSKKLMFFTAMLAVYLFTFLFASEVAAHHVLGRPSYSLNEDSNTPPSMEVETQIGDYFVTYMVFPAFPVPKQPGRVNLYATRIDNGEVFDGKVRFSVRNDSWFKSEREELGVQTIDDGVYRQGFVFQEKGDYIITAEFESDGQPYIIDFPLRIGETATIGPIGIAVAVIVIVLVAVNILQRKRMQRLKTRSYHAEKDA